MSNDGEGFLYLKRRHVANKLQCIRKAKPAKCFIEIRIARLAIERHSNEQQTQK